MLKAVTLALLIIASVFYFTGYITQLATDPSALLPQMLWGLGLCLLWLLAAAASRRQ